MRAYLALLGAGFQRQTAYRLALMAGLATNAFFGVVRTAIVFALYRERGQVAGLDVAAALTYVWVLEGMFAVVWAPWVWEMAEPSARASSWSSCCGRATCTCAWPPSTWAGR